jgi:hypothetical protein
MWATVGTTGTPRPRRAPDVDVDALLAGLVEAVEGDHQGLAELAELLAQGQAGLQGGGIDDLDQQVRRLEAALAGLPADEGQQHPPVGFGQIVEGAHRGQVDEISLLEADVDPAGGIGQRAAFEAAGLHRRARGRLEEGALAPAGQAHQRDVRAPLAAQQLAGHRDVRDHRPGLGHGRHLAPDRRIRRPPGQGSIGHGNRRSKVPQIVRSMRTILRPEPSQPAAPGQTRKPARVIISRAWARLVTPAPAGSPTHGP